jgi:hypothetical protein
MRSEYSILVGKPPGKGQLRIPRCRWQDNVIMDLREIDLEYIHWMDVIQDRNQWRVLVNTIVRLLVPYKAGNFFTS